MTLERQYDRIIFICDQKNSPSCEEEMKTGTHDWTEARKALDAAGWRAVRSDNGWTHCCSRCLVPRGNGVTAARIGQASR